MFILKKDIRMVIFMVYSKYFIVGEDLFFFVLYDQLYYVNGIELVVFVMEMSFIVGKNVVLLVYNYWYGNLDKIDEFYLDLVLEKDKIEL